MVLLFVLSTSPRNIPVSSLSPSLSSPVSKDFMYTAFILFCLMKIVWICAFQSVKKRDPLFLTAAKRLLCYSPKNWFRLFKGLLFTALSPCVDARQAQLIFSEFEVIVLNWQTKHLSPWVFHFYRVNSFGCTNTHMNTLSRWLAADYLLFFFCLFLEEFYDFKSRRIDTGTNNYFFVFTTFFFFLKILPPKFSKVLKKLLYFKHFSSQMDNSLLQLLVKYHMNVAYTQMLIILFIWSFTVLSCQIKICLWLPIKTFTHTSLAFF